MSFRDREHNYFVELNIFDSEKGAYFNTELLHLSGAMTAQFIVPSQISVAVHRHLMGWLYPPRHLSRNGPGTILTIFMRLPVD